MDVDRYEKDMAALTPSHVVSALNLSGIDRSFGNATLYTWTAGLERKFGNLTADASYVGTAAEKLPRYSFPNAYPGASPGFAPHTQFDSAGNVIGGFGVENVIIADCALHLSRAADFALGNGGAWRPGHPGQLHLEQVDRRHQRGDRRHRINRRRHFRLLAESVRHASRKRPVVLRRDAWHSA